MAALHSRHTTRRYYLHTTSPLTYSSSWYTPSRCAGNKDDMPWHHMAHTYAWVVENEYDKGNRKTEQWVLQQQMFLEAENAKLRSAGRGNIWEETVYWYEMEAERRGEEMRRRAAEKEKKARLIDAEIERIETRVRNRLEEERRKRAEEGRRMEEKQKEQGKRVVMEAWREYEERWSKLLSSSEALEFSSIPWPLVSTPGKAEDITAQAVVGFLLSHVHSEKQTQKERLRRAQLRWHPDRFQRVLGRVRLEDKAEVERAVGIVARALNDFVPY